MFKEIRFMQKEDMQKICKDNGFNCSHCPLKTFVDTGYGQMTRTCKLDSPLYPYFDKEYLKKTVFIKDD